MSISGKLSVVALLFTLFNCTPLRRGIIGLVSSNDAKAASSAPGPAVLNPKEAPEAKENSLSLQLVASGFQGITDIQFLPAESRRAVVLEKSGKAFLVDLTTNQKSNLFEVKVETASELGLLGMAFHPKFASNKKFYVHYNPRGDLSRISEWAWIEQKSKAGESVAAKETRTILEVEQPYQNHNGGSLAFGPDGKLYIGFGDGGWRGDPENRAQNLKTLLGKMLRIDIDSVSDNPPKPYVIPNDNPFVRDDGAAKEIFAYGLRNPWKYSFDSKGRLIAGDVGQDKWEEITFVNKGANLGWRFFEASHCYDPSKNCEKVAPKTLGPIAEYDHALGASVTGGYEYLGSQNPALKGRYVFGDFVTGRIWSIELPAEPTTSPMRGKDLRLHGKWDILISTFARDASGELYTGDFSSGSIYRLTQPKTR